MLEKIKKFLGVTSFENKIQEYLDLQKEDSLLKADLSELSDYYHTENDRFEKAISCPSNLGVVDRLQDKHSVFLSDYIKDLSKIKKSIEKNKSAIDSIEKNYAGIAEAARVVREQQAFETIKKSFYGGGISRGGYDNIIKAKTGVVHYSDMVVRDTNGRLLLLQRAKGGDFEPEKWGLPGGHVDLHEDPTVAAVRELEEETGLKVTGCVKVGEYNDEKAKICYYEAYLENGVEPEPVLNSEEHQDYKWVDFKDIDEMDLMMNLKESLKKIMVPIEQSVVKIEKSLDSDIKKDEKQAKVAYVMKEFKEGRLKDSHGKKVTDRNQAIAIALSEAGLSKGGFVDLVKSIVQKYKDKIEKMDERRDPEGLENDEGIEKANSAQVGEIHEWKGQKMQKTSQGWVPVKDGMKGIKEGDDKKKVKEQSLEELTEHARNSSEQDLQNTIKNSPDEKLRKQAYEELERRKNEEYPQKEEGKNKDSVQNTSKDTVGKGNGRDFKNEISEIEKQIREERSKEIPVDLEDYFDKVVESGNRVKKLINARRRLVEEQESLKKVEISDSSSSLKELRQFGSYNIEILAKKGSNVANLDNEGELEYLIDKDSKFRVVKKYEDGVIVEFIITKKKKDTRFMYDSDSGLSVVSSDKLEENKKEEVKKSVTNDILKRIEKWL